MAVWSRRAEPNVFKPVTDLRGDATVSAGARGDGGVCVSGVLGLASVAYWRAVRRSRCFLAPLR